MPKLASRVTVQCGKSSGGSKPEHGADFYPNSGWIFADRSPGGFLFKLWVKFRKECVTMVTIKLFTGIKTMREIDSREVAGEYLFLHIGSLVIKVRKADFNLNGLNAVVEG